MNRLSVRGLAVWLAVGAGLLVLLLVVSLLPRGEPRPLTDGQLRIVSLAPSITQVVNELGLGRQVVAVGDFDELAPPDTPSLGRYVDLDLERLTTLAPTHVLAMTGQAGLPTRVGELAEAGRFALADLPYPGSVGAAVGLIAEVGAAIGRAEAGAALSAEVRRQLDGIAALTRGKPRPSALIVFTVDPVMASGPGTINDELLAIAGGRNAAADANVSAPIYDREALRARDPDVLFLMRPGEPPLTGPDDRRLRSFRGLRAVQEGRVLLLNDPAVLLPGPAMGTTAVSLAVKLHPELAEPIGAVFAGPDFRGGGGPDEP